MSIVSHVFDGEKSYEIKISDGELAGESRHDLLIRLELIREAYRTFDLDRAGALFLYTASYHARF